MKSRMEKYYDSNGENLRTKKNEEIYKKVHDSEIKDFDINSNVSVIGDSSKNIDVENLRQILDKKYRDIPKRKSIALDVSNNDYKTEEEIKDEDKDYDINVILEKARKQKQVDYQEERLKKVRDTQFDILKGLNLENNDQFEDETDENQDEEKKLMTLINTIASNELLNEQASSSDPLDLLEDLKGNEDTKILPIDEIKTMEIKSKDEIKEIGKKEVEKEKSEKKEPISEKEEIKKLENSFFTNSIKLNKKDFEDFEDLQGEYKRNPLKVILIIILIIAFVVGIFFLVNKIFDLNLINKVIKLIK